MYWTGLNPFHPREGEGRLRLPYEEDDEEVAAGIHQGIALWGYVGLGIKTTKQFAT